MSESLISVIIPIYNVEKYLDRCLKSIISQSYKNIEIILIDDGSKDASSKICDDYAKSDNRIRVIHKKNEGVAIARNLGIKKATGKYITFIDADDYVEKDYVKILYELCRDHDVSIVGTIDENDEQVVISKSKSMIKIANGKEAIKEMLVTNRFFGWTCWNKMYKTEIVKNVKFREKVKIAEDVEFLYNVIKKAKKVNIDTSYKLYHYVLDRKGSATEAKFNDDRKTEMQIYKSMKDDMEKIMPQDIELIKAWYLKRILLTIALNLKTSNDKKYLRYLVNELKQIRLKNKYITKKQKILYSIIMINPKLLKVLYKLKR